MTKLPECLDDNSPKKIRGLDDHMMEPNAKAGAFLDFDTWMITGKVPDMDAFVAAGFDQHVYQSMRASRKADSPKDYLTSSVSLWILREAIIRDFGHALPCAEIVDFICGLAPILEVGAGSGYWSAILAAAGCDIIGTDPTPWPRCHPVGTGGVLQMTADQALQAYPDRTILSVWPSSDGWFSEMLRLMKPGQKIILVSEMHGGMTGEEEMFEVLASDFVVDHQLEIPKWPGLKDCLVAGHKR